MYEAIGEDIDHVTAVAARPQLKFRLRRLICAVMCKAIRIFSRN